MLLLLTAALLLLPASSMARGRNATNRGVQAENETSREMIVTTGPVIWVASELSVTPLVPIRPTSDELGIVPITPFLPGGGGAGLVPTTPLLPGGGEAGVIPYTPLLPGGGEAGVIPYTPLLPGGGEAGILPFTPLLPGGEEFVIPIGPMFPEGGEAGVMPFVPMLPGGGEEGIIPYAPLVPNGGLEGIVPLVPLLPQSFDEFELATSGLVVVPDLGSDTVAALLGAQTTLDSNIAPTVSHLLNGMLAGQDAGCVFAVDDDHARHGSIWFEFEACQVNTHSDSAVYGTGSVQTEGSDMTLEMLLLVDDGDAWSFVSIYANQSGS